jgi:Fe-S-cluster containining protein
VEVDEPTTPRDYDQIHWYLTHRDVSVYVDWDAAWFVEFKTLCDHLTESGTCDIYRERPELCSEFSWETCETSTGDPGHRLFFNNPQEFFDWFQAKRPRSFERYAKYRKALLEKRTDPSPGPARRRSTARAQPRRGVQSSTSI